MIRRGSPVLSKVTVKSGVAVSTTWNEKPSAAQVSGSSNSEEDVRCPWAGGVGPAADATPAGAARLDRAGRAPPRWSGRVDRRLGAIARLDGCGARRCERGAGRGERVAGGLPVGLDLREQRGLRIEEPCGVTDVGPLLLDLRAQGGAGRLVVRLGELLLQLPQGGLRGAYLRAGGGALGGDQLAERSVACDVGLAGVHDGGAGAADLGGRVRAGRAGNRRGVVRDGRAGERGSGERATGEEGRDGRAGKRATEVQLHGDSFLEASLDERRTDVQWSSGGSAGGGPGLSGPGGGGGCGGGGPRPVPAPPGAGVPRGLV